MIVLNNLYVFFIVNKPIVYSSCLVMLASYLALLLGEKSLSIVKTHSGRLQIVAIAVYHKQKPNRNSSSS